MNIMLMYIAHMLGWFVLSGLASVITGRTAVMKWASALAMGFVSGSLQIILCHLGYINV